VKVQDVIPIPLAAVFRPLCPPPQKNISGLSIKREGAPAFAGPGYARFSSDESRPAAQLRATEPSTIRDAIRVHATLDPHGPRLSAPNALP